MQQAHLKQLGVLAQFVVSVVTLSQSAGAQTSAEGVAKPRRVVCTVVPVYSFARNVVGDVSGVELELLLAPNLGCPHDYALTVRDGKLLADANLVLGIGLGLERFLDPIKKGGKTRIVELGSVASVITCDHDHAEGDHAGEHGPGNPHVWTSPTEAAKLVVEIGRILGELDPPNRDKYSGNAAAYSKRLAALADDMKRAAERFRSRKIATQHDVFAYLARDLRLDVVAVLEIDQQDGQSPRALEKHISAIKSSGAAAIFAERGSTSRTVEAIARQSGVPRFDLDPLTMCEQPKPEADYYEARMRANLKTLQAALGGAD